MTRCEAWTRRHRLHFMNDRPTLTLDTSQFQGDEQRPEAERHGSRAAVPRGEAHGHVLRLEAGQHGAHRDGREAQRRRQAHQPLKEPHGPDATADGILPASAAMP